LWGFCDGGGGRSAAVPEERRGLISGADDDNDLPDGGGDHVIEMDLLPPRWLDIRDEVTDTLATIALEMQRLDQMHQKHLLPGFDDDSVKRREEQDIERLTRKITHHFQECRLALNRLDAIVKELGSSGTLGRSEEMLARNLKMSMAERIGDVSGLFRKKQSAYLKRLQAVSGFAAPPTFPRASTPVVSGDSASLQESESDRRFSQSTLQQAQQHRGFLSQQRSGVSDADIAQREREIEDIAQGIIDLANIFQELQKMVVDQGSLLDRIDYSVENAAVNIKTADKELVVASGYQRRATKRKIMLLLVIVIVGVGILLSLKLGSRGGSSVGVGDSGGGGGGDDDRGSPFSPSTASAPEPEPPAIRRSHSMHSMRPRSAMGERDEQPDAHPLFSHGAGSSPGGDGRSLETADASLPSTSALDTVSSWKKRRRRAAATGATGGTGGPGASAGSEHTFATLGPGV